MVCAMVFKGQRVTVLEHPYVVSIRRLYAHYLVGVLLTKNVGTELCLARSSRFFPDERFDPMLRSISFTMSPSNYCEGYTRVSSASILRHLPWRIRPGRPYTTRGYQTISFEAATILARFPPLDILAEMDARVYVRLRLDDGSGIAPAEVRFEERQRALRRWCERLEEPQNSRRLEPDFCCICTLTKVYEPLRARSINIGPPGF
ncbi:Trypsin [Operophtera brumata]|uniref:Trypsin n=1 Tax=Operophtera brumata TaxID=104452 RepID=A0A0L7LKN9_OPEBR|nr:Trypsin [Operophtera brumata]